MRAYRRLRKTCSNIGDYGADVSQNGVRVRFARAF